MALIELRDVVKEYPGTGRGRGAVRAVDGVDLDIEAGSVTGVIGYSGAGKSTLVRLVNALEPVTSGSIRIDGQELVGLPERRLRGIRAGIGMVFQQFNLFASRSVAGNVAYPLRVAGVEREERERRVAELLEWVGLADRAKARVDELSGGQKQRVGLARALANAPRILLADEATSALDPQTTAEVLGLLRRANEELGLTIIVITHEMDVVREIASQVAVMERGRVVERGDVFDVFATPSHPATRRFVETVVEGTPSGRTLEELRSRHHGATLATVSFHDGAGDQPALFRILGDAARERGVSAQLVAGGIDEIRGRTVGRLTFALDGAAEHVDAVLRQAADVGVVERLGDGWAEAAVTSEGTANTASGALR
ncbi:Methionine import ATP-binding protein MetN 2 [Pseudoclavibacter triregionum]|nr:Methionine import ATP-binding protein MetN 2 [Pseudoclavibacter triregionum]